MMNPVLAALIPTTYRQSDLAYRLGLLREFLEFVFFTQQANGIGPDALSAFASAGSQDSRDLEILQHLPQALHDSFRSESFSVLLDQALGEAKALTTVRLTVAVLLPSEEVAAVGKWVREAVGEQAMLELSLDPEIGAGCQLLWQNVLHDYSLEQHLRVHEPQLYEHLVPLLSAQSIV